jgi:hypothetical protein
VRVYVNKRTPRVREGLNRVYEKKIDKKKKKKKKKKKGKPRE